MMKRILSLFLTLLMLNSLCIYSDAADSGFISVDMVRITDDGEEVKKYALYTDGEHLYAPVALFEDYTFYEFDDANSSFVRCGQQYPLHLSGTEIDFEKKIATVKIMEKKTEFNLHNVFTFGNSHFLPLDQMCGYLMSSVKVKDGRIYILNSGYSICDAAYSFSVYSPLYRFNYNHIVDDIFAGNEKLYTTYCVFGYIGATLFGWKTSNLDVYGKKGDIESYENILEGCITDNSTYIEAQKDTDSFISRISSAKDVTGFFNKAIGEMKEVTTVSLYGYTEFEETDNPICLDPLYYDVKDANDALKIFSGVIHYVDFYAKLMAMLDDHKNMLRVGDERSYLCLDGTNFNVALHNIYGRFGGSNFKAVGLEVLRTLYDDIKDNVEDVLLTLPVKAVIKTVNLGFKLLGFDLADNTQYDAMLETIVVSDMADIYNDCYNSAADSIKSSEEFRLSAIYMLLAMKHAFETGNRLNAKLGFSGNIFKEELESIKARLVLFYQAAESRNYDSYEDLKNIIEENHKVISESKIIETAERTRQPLCSSIVASEEDLEHFLDVIRTYSQYKHLDYDCEREDSFYKAMDIVVGEIDAVYECYYDKEPVRYTPDPLKAMYGDHNGWFEYGYGYKVYSENNINRLMSEIFNISADESISVDGNEYSESEKMIYFYDKHYYSYVYPPGTDLSFVADRIVSYKFDELGRYVFTVERSTIDHSAISGTIEVVADLKKFNGRNEWSFYKITDSVLSEIPEEEDREVNSQTGYLVATEAEINQLRDLLRNPVYFDNEDFDCEAEDALEKAMLLTMGSCGTYSTYFESVEDSVNNIPDPYDKFNAELIGYCYKTYSAYDANWVLKNIYNVTPDESVVVPLTGSLGIDTYIYFYDEAYYAFDPQVSSTLFFDLEIAECEILDDGRYEVLINYLDYDNNVSESMCFVVALKDIDGEKLWSIFSSEKIS